MDICGDACHAGATGTGAPAPPHVPAIATTHLPSLAHGRQEWGQRRLKGRALPLPQRPRAIRLHGAAAPPCAR
jgi:hypothetical protein